MRECEATFGPSADLDAVALLEEHLGTGWPHPTHVVFDAPAEEVAPFVGAAWGQLEPDPQDGSRCVLTGTTNNPDMYVAERLAAVPVPFTIAGGTELRGAMQRLLDRLEQSLEER